MTSPTIESIAQDIEWIKNALKDMKEGQEKYVTKQEFWPVKTIVYGGAGLVMTGVFGALIALVIKK